MSAKVQPNLADIRALSSSLFKCGVVLRFASERAGHLINTLHISTYSFKNSNMLPPSEEMSTVSTFHVGAVDTKEVSFRRESDVSRPACSQDNNALIALPRPGSLDTYLRMLDRDRRMELVSQMMMHPGAITINRMVPMVRLRQYEIESLQFFKCKKCRIEGASVTAWRAGIGGQCQFCKHIYNSAEIRDGLEVHFKQQAQLLHTLQQDLQECASGMKSLRGQVARLKALVKKLKPQSI